MKIGSIGYNYVHDMKYENFIMDRPKGPGAVLLLLIKTPAVFKVGGVQYQVKENSFILMSADTPCYYTAQEDVYTDDWVYFENDYWDKEYVEKLGIPMNIPVYLGDIDELSHLVHILVYEHYSGAVNSEEIEKKYIDVLFLMLSRTLKSRNCMSSKQLSERHYRFTQIRTMIFTMPDHVGNVDDLAAQAGMSRSRFQHLYKKAVRNNGYKGYNRGQDATCETSAFLYKTYHKRDKRTLWLYERIQLYAAVQGTGRKDTDRVPQQYIIYKENVYEEDIICHTGTLHDSFGYCLFIGK